MAPSHQGFIANEKNWAKSDVTLGMALSLHETVIGTVSVTQKMDTGYSKMNSAPYPNLVVMETHLKYHLVGAKNCGTSGKGVTKLSGV